MAKRTPMSTTSDVHILGPPLPDVQQMKARGGARLLSLDGGGVKGISSVVILDAIMKRVQQIENQSGSDVSTTPRKPVDYFDLAGGTSTGGLIALMLFRLRMNTQECYHEYYDLAQHIFARKFFGSKILGSLFGTVGLTLKAFFRGAQFGATPLEAAIRDVVGRRSFPGNDPQKDLLVNPNAGMMFMCATLKDVGESIILRSYVWPEDATPITGPAQQKRDADQRLHPQTDGTRLLLNEIPIVNAARATSAAPIYLPKEEWHGMVFWDGGVLNNNPIEQVWNARYDLVSSTSPPPHVSCVLSLGVGYASKDGRNFLRRWAHSMHGVINIGARFLESYMANTKAKAADFQRLVQRMQGRTDLNGDIQYFRFNADCGDNDFNMADYRIMQRLEELTRTYLVSSAQARADVEACAQLLAKKPALVSV